jgi:hypothetical protein
MGKKNTYTSVFLKAAGLDHDEDQIKNVKGKWWFSTREKPTGGLRITDACLEFLEEQAKIKTYQIDLPKDMTIGPQILIWLDQFIESPYHLSKNHLKVLTEKSAFELYLFSGDVRKLGINKALHKRLSQESHHE